MADSTAGVEIKLPNWPSVENGGYENRQRSTKQKSKRRRQIETPWSEKKGKKSCLIPVVVFAVPSSSRNERKEIFLTPSLSLVMAKRKGREREKKSFSPFRFFFSGKLNQKETFQSNNIRLTLFFTGRTEYSMLYRMYVQGGGKEEEGRASKRK